MKQSRKASLIEVASSTLLGLVVASIANYLVLPIWGYHPSLLNSFGIGAIFTVISLIRSYLFRRAFEWLRVSGYLP